MVERLIEVGAREMGVDPPICARRISSRHFPHQTPVIMNYDAGDYHASLKKALEIADYSGFGKRGNPHAMKSCAASASRPTSKPAVAPSQAVGSLGCGVGHGRSAEVRVNPTGSVEVLTGCHQHGQGHETTFAQVVAGSASRSTMSASCMATPTRCNSAWAPMARAPARSDLRDREGARQDRDQGEEGRRAPDGSGGRRHRVQGRQVHGGGNRQVGGLG